MIGASRRSPERTLGTTDGAATAGMSPACPVTPDHVQVQMSGMKFIMTHSHRPHSMFVDRRVVMLIVGTRSHPTGLAKVGVIGATPTAPEVGAKRAVIHIRVAETGTIGGRVPPMPPTILHIPRI